MRILIVDIDQVKGSNYFREDINIFLRTWELPYEEIIFPDTEEPEEIANRETYLKKYIESNGIDLVLCFSNSFTDLLENLEEAGMISCIYFYLTTSGDKFEIILFKDREKKEVYGIMSFKAELIGTAGFMLVTTLWNRFYLTANIYGMNWMRDRVEFK